MRFAVTFVASAVLGVQVLSSLKDARQPWSPPTLMRSEWWSNLAAVRTATQPGAPNKNPIDAEAAAQSVDLACSCWNSSSRDDGPFLGATPDPCCRRVAISGHKFGTVLKHRLFMPFPWIEQSVFTASLVPAVGMKQDYRHVAIVRNLYSALVSGYLYHKSGRECWLDRQGRPWKKDLLHNFSQVLESHYNHFDVGGNGSSSSSSLPSLGPYPDPRGRSLCQYLADEPAEVGMKAYLAFCRHNCYNGILPYMAAELTHFASHYESNRLLRVCLEEASDPAKEEEVFYRLMDFLYPGGHNWTFPGSVPEAAGHGTDHNDLEYRQSLLALAKRYDAEIFGGDYAAMNSYVGCAETVR